MLFNPFYSYKIKWRIIFLQSKSYILEKHTICGNVPETEHKIDSKKLKIIFLAKIRNIP